MKPELVYLLGAYLSDGCLSWAGRDPHPIWCVKDESFAGCISIALTAVGSLHTFGRGKRGYYQVLEKSGGQLGKWLHKVAPDKAHLPNIPKELVRPLVAGLMDGDGHISMSKQGGIRMGYCGERDFVPDFYKLLEGLGVSLGCPGFVRSIRVESFLIQGLNFAMPRKQMKLALWCCRMVRTALGRGWSSDLRRAKVANRWMKEVWSKDILTSIPV